MLGPFFLPRLLKFGALTTDYFCEQFFNLFEESVYNFKRVRTTKALNEIPRDVIPAAFDTSEIVHAKGNILKINLVVEPCLVCSFQKFPSFVPMC